MATLYPELDLIWLTKVKASLAKHLSTSVNSFDDMFFVEFFGYIDHIQQKIEEEKLAHIQSRTGMSL